MSNLSNIKLCAGCSCDGQLHDLQAADPHDQEKRAGSWALDWMTSREQTGEKEGEVKREGDRGEKGWRGGLTPLLGQGPCGQQALWEEVWGIFVLSIDSLNSIKLCSALSISPGVLPWLHMWLNDSAAAMSSSTSVSWKAALWAKEDDICFFCLLLSCRGLSWSTLVYDMGCDGLLRRVTLSHALHHPTLAWL